MFWVWVGLACLVIAPPLFAVKFGARWRWLLMGIASWMLGLLVKNILLYLLDLFGEAHWPVGVRGVIEGILAAVCELGAAVLFLRRPIITLPDAIGFGLAVGCFEAVCVFGLGLLEGVNEHLRFTHPAFGFVTVSFLCERTFALAGHTAACVLIFLALRKKMLLPAVIAFVLSSFIDGLTAYGVAAAWNWDDPRIDFPFQITVSIVAMLGTVAAIWFATRIRPQV